MTPEPPNIAAGGSEAPAEPPLPGEMEALDEAEGEYREGKTNRLDDVLRHLSPRSA